MSYGLLLLRVVVGTTMAGHGSQKVFGWFGGGGPKGTAEAFGKLGFRAPALMALLAGLGELAGAAFAVGFLTQLAALALVVVMLNAIAVVHWKNGFWVTGGGYEYNLVLLTVAVAVAATGPGRFSIDAALGWDGSLSGVRWGAGVLAAAIVVSAATVTFGRTRKAPPPMKGEPGPA